MELSIVPLSGTDLKGAAFGGPLPPTTFPGSGGNGHRGWAVGEEPKTVADPIAGRAAELTATERGLDAFVAELVILDAAAHVSTVRRREESSVRLTQAADSLKEVPEPEVADCAVGCREGEWLAGNGLERAR